MEEPLPISYTVKTARQSNCARRILQQSFFLPFGTIAALMAANYPLDQVSLAKTEIVNAAELFPVDGPPSQHLAGS